MGTSSVNTVKELPSKVAVIIDAPQFYHSSFVDDVLNGFSLINQTYQTDYDIYQLTNFTLVSVSPLQFTYTYNGSTTNHTELTLELINSEEYDLIILVGYFLRHNFLEFSDYPETNFLFFDLSGVSPAFQGDNIPENLLIVSYDEGQLGFLAGSIFAEEFDPLPQKIAIIGAGTWDPRSRLLMSGFQAGVFRKTINLDIQINYLNTWYDSAKASNFGSDLSNQGFDVVFSAFQANHTLEIIESFTGGDVICVDLNQSMSVMKNNSHVLLDIFSAFNENEGFFGGLSVVYGISDGVFFGYGWTDPVKVNETINDVAEAISSEGLIIPTNIKTASNTPSFNHFLAIIGLFIVPIYRKKQRR
jgi:basic membrane lipoprotein Med (substrate-binding protein (PBP1-ABC) superfamily)